MINGKLINICSNNLFVLSRMAIFDYICNIFLAAVFFLHITPCNHRGWGIAPHPRIYILLFSSSILVHFPHIATKSEHFQICDFSALFYTAYFK